MSGGDGETKRIGEGLRERRRETEREIQIQREREGYPTDKKRETEGERDTLVS